jgi:hypothetical protein
MAPKEEVRLGAMSGRILGGAERAGALRNVGVGDDEFENGCNVWPAFA